MRQAVDDSLEQARHRANEYFSQVHP
jgi:hypothetical protein